MFPAPHELPHLARQKQQEFLAEAEHRRLVRRATALPALDARPAGGRRVSLSALRIFLAGTLYALARWIDAGDAPLHPVDPSP